MLNILDPTPCTAPSGTAMDAGIIRKVVHIVDNNLMSLAFAAAATNAARSLPHRIVHTRGHNPA